MRSGEKRQKRHIQEQLETLSPNEVKNGKEHSIHRIPIFKF